MNIVSIIIVVGAILLMIQGIIGARFYTNSPAQKDAGITHWYDASTFFVGLGLGFVLDHGVKVFASFASKSPGASRFVIVGSIILLSLTISAIGAYNVHQFTKISKVSDDKTRELDVSQAEAVSLATVGLGVGVILSECFEFMSWVLPRCISQFIAFFAVIIFGISAGSVSIHLHNVLKGEKGPYTFAIIALIANILLGVGGVVLLIIPGAYEVICGLEEVGSGIGDLEKGEHFLKDVDHHKNILGHMEHHHNTQHHSENTQHHTYDRSKNHDHKDGGILSSTHHHAPVHAEPTRAPLRQSLLDHPLLNYRPTGQEPGGADAQALRARLAGYSARARDSVSNYSARAEGVFGKYNEWVKSGSGIVRRTASAMEAIAPEAAEAGAMAV